MVASATTRPAIISLGNSFFSPFGDLQVAFPGAGRTEPLGVAAKAASDLAITVGFCNDLKLGPCNGFWVNAPAMVHNKQTTTAEEYSFMITMVMRLFDSKIGQVESP